MAEPRRHLVVPVLAAVLLAGCRLSGESPAGPDGTPYYATCAQVVAASAAPLHRGQPGYRPALDRGGDGVACDA